ncbi:uncharacterized protein LOC119584358 [Penaeus monodon]|uniref:uncharacterized protein LOC119584358 n=1 Tax=Penaeus monodon TaxID=6687 RepID=UPI0018A73D47|nr:uncharacterized protein LOC119584358 [Penaeus monodon]XP_037788854.1 uncharacterized protein LOC119584358 [Penaeus monodon]
MTRVMFLAAIAAFAICAEAASLGPQGELHRAKRQFSWSSDQDVKQYGVDTPGGEQFVSSHNTFLGNNQRVGQLGFGANNKQFVHQGFSLFGPSKQEVEQIAKGGGFQHQTVSQKGSIFGHSSQRVIQQGGTKQIVTGK